MHPAHVEYYTQIKARLEAASQGECKAIVQDAASFMGSTPATVYRNLRKVGWVSNRKVRSDCGKIAVDEALARQVAGIVKACTRANGKRTLPITTTVAILQENGKGVTNMETGEVVMPHPCTLSRAMKQYGCHPDQVKRGRAAQSLRTLHPNHWWEMDASVCLLFYLPKGKIQVMREDKYYKNKPAHLAKVERLRIIRWVITDHYTGTLFVRYAEGTEDQKSALTVLMEALCDRTAENPMDIFRGAPYGLYTDKGAPFVGNMTQKFLQHLRIRPETHKAGNPRATGQAENAQNLVETQFEGRLRMMVTDALADLNAAADKWRIAFNANAIHSRHKKTRHSLWMTITPEQLRVPESREALQAIVSSKGEERTIPPTLILSYATKQFGPQEYSLSHIPGVIIGNKVGVCVNPFEAPAIDVTIIAANGEETVYTLQPIRRNDAGFDVTAPVMGEEYRAMPDTVVDQAVKAMEKAAYGAETLEAVDKARKKNARVYEQINPMADIEALRPRTYFPVQGTGLDLAAPVREMPPLSMVEAAMKLKSLMAEAAVTWTETHMAELIARYEDSVPHDDIAPLAAEFISAARPPVPETAPALNLVRGAA